MNEDGLSNIFFSLTSELQTAIEVKRPEKSDHENGFAGGQVCKKPKVISMELIEISKAELSRLEELFKQATKRQVKRWLLEFGKDVRSNYSEDEARAVIERMSTDISNGFNYPAFCFTEESRRRAVLVFDWFPKLLALSEFLKGLHAVERRVYDVITSIAKATPTGPDGLPLELSKLIERWSEFLVKDLSDNDLKQDLAILSTLDPVSIIDGVLKVRATTRFLYDQAVEIEQDREHIRRHFERLRVVIFHERRCTNFDPVQGKLGAP